MSSRAEFKAWLDRHRELVRETRPDPADAKAKLVRAERNLDRARSHAVADPDFALVAAASALLNLADSVRAAHGFRVRGKTGSHDTSFAFPGLPRGFREHSTLIAATRKSRNSAMYDTAGIVSASFVGDVTRVVSQLLEEVRRR